jgi:hypothetical protein
MFASFVSVTDHQFIEDKNVPVLGFAEFEGVVHDDVHANNPVNFNFQQGNKSGVVVLALKTITGVVRGV